MTYSLRNIRMKLRHIHLFSRGVRTLLTKHSAMTTTREFRLTEQEKELISLLKEITEHMKKEQPELPHVQLRIAGGWVRDKVISRK